jgi:hypothetical protein
MEINLDAEDLKYIRIMIKREISRAFHKVFTEIDEEVLKYDKERFLNGS